MILIISSKDDVTADLVQDDLKSRCVEFLRFNSEDYPGSVELCFDYSSSHPTGSLSAGDRQIAFSDVRTVWYRKPSGPCISSDVTHEQAKKFAEDESNAALTGLYNALRGAFWVSRPERIRMANDKLLQLAVAREFGHEVPRTLVTNSPESARRFYDVCQGRVVIKPLRAGLIEYPDGSVEVIYTTPLSAGDLAEFDKVAYAPCLLQEYVEKAIELRVTVIGGRMFCVALDTQSSDVHGRLQDGVGAKVDCGCRTETCVLALHVGSPDGRDEAV